MSRFIGEDLNPKQIAALQAVAHGCGGCQLVHVDKLPSIIETHRDCWELTGIESQELMILLDELEAHDLIERKLHKNASHVGLTEDGQRCNLISVY